MRIINSNHSDRLKISTAQLLFGNCVNLDRGMFRPIDEVPPSKKSMSVYMSNPLKTQDSLRKAAAKELLRTDLLHMTHKKQLQHTDYQPGTYVLVHYRTGHPPTLLHTFWRGPMRVISGSNSRFTLYDLISHVEKEYHVSIMKLFLFDPLSVEPLDVARHDYMEFYIENTCKPKYKMSPSSVRSEGGEAAAGYCLNSVSYRVDEAVKYNVLNSD